MHLIIAIIILTFCVSEIRGTVQCTSSPQYGRTPIYYSFTATGSTSCTAQVMRQIPDSGNIYYHSEVYDSGWKSYVSKVDYEMNELWSKVWDDDMSNTNFDVCSDETYAFSTIYRSPLYLYQFNATDGSMDYSVTSADLQSKSQAALQVDGTCSNVYFTADITGSGGGVCKYSLSTNTIDCIYFGTTYYLPVMLTLVSDSQIYSYTRETTTYNGVISLIDYDAASVTWTDLIACPSGTCNYKRSSSVQIDDLMYNSVIFNSNWIFFILNITDGSHIGSVYKKSSVSCTTGSHRVISDSDLIYPIFICGSTTYILTYDTTSDTFIDDVSSTTANKFYDISYDSTYFYLSGQEQTGSYDCLYAKVSQFDSIDILDATIGTQTEIIATYTISTVADIAITIVNPTQSSVTVSTLASSNMPTVVDLTESYIPDTILVLDDIDLGTMDERTSQTVPIDITCSVDLSTDISYSITDVVGDASTFVSVDDSSNTGLLVINAPDVIVDTYYEFLLISSFNSSSYPITVNLTIVDIPVTDEESDPDVSTFMITTLTTASLMVVNASLNSLLGANSSNCIWIMINFYQMLLLLPLLKIHMDKKLVSYIIGLDVSMFSFGFLDLKRASYSSSVHYIFDCEQSDEYLDAIDISCISIFPIISLIFMVALCHLVLECIACSSKRSDNCVIKLIRSLCSAIKYSFYLRTLVESYIMIALSGFSEIYTLDKNTHIISYTSIGVCLFILALLFCISIFVANKSLRRQSKVKNWATFYEGIKGNKKSRAYHVLFLAKRLALGAWVIYAQSLNKYMNIVDFSVIQTIHLIYLVSARPFEAKHENLIELINEVLYTIVCYSFMYFNSDKVWNTTISDIYIYTFISHTLLITLISFAVMVKTLYSKWCKKSQTRVYRVDVKPAPEKHTIQKSTVSAQNMVKTSESKPIDSNIMTDFDAYERYYREMNNKNSHSDNKIDVKSTRKRKIYMRD